MFWIFFSSTIGVAFLIAVLVYYFAAGLGDLKSARREWRLLGLSEGFVPQGITFVKSENKFLVSGYMTKGRASRVYVVDPQQNNLQYYVTFKTKQGQEYLGHAGGICVYNNYGYISGEGKVFRFLLSDVLSSKPADVVKFDYEFSSENGADFCLVNGNTLWVGEFYKMGKYKTDPTHHILLDGGNYHCAIVFGFSLSDNGMPSIVPQKALSIPDTVQGMAFSLGRIFLSSSYAANKSRLIEYENVFQKNTAKYIIFKDKKVPLYVLENKYLRKTKILPPMSEEIVCEGGRIYVVFESGANKYKFFMRTRLYHVFSIKVNWN